MDRTSVEFCESENTFDEGDDSLRFDVEQLSPSLPEVRIQWAEMAELLSHGFLQAGGFAEKKIISKIDHFFIAGEIFSMSASPHFREATETRDIEEVRLLSISWFVMAPEAIFPQPGFSIRLTDLPT
jgi:hypothetical protein